MKKLYLIALLSLAANSWADCWSEDKDLTDLLSKPLGKNHLVAVVKGTRVELENKKEEWTDYIYAEKGAMVDHIDVKKSFGKHVPPGRYAILEVEEWGANCHFSKDRVHYSQLDGTPRTIYLPVTYIDKRNHFIFTPEYEGRGAPYQGGKVSYKRYDRPLRAIDQATFERNLSRGIAKRNWHTSKRPGDGPESQPPPIRLIEPAPPR